MSLPPELGAIDDSWGEDEQPTIARSSRMPTAPVRIELPDEIPTAPRIDLAALERAAIESLAKPPPGSKQTHVAAPRVAPNDADIAPGPVELAPEVPLISSEQGSLLRTHQLTPTGLEIDLADEGEDIQERVTTVPQIPPDEYARMLMAADPQQAVTEAPPPPDVGSSEFDLSLEPPRPLPPSEMPTAPPPSSDFFSAPVSIPASGSVGPFSLNTGTLPTDRPPPVPALSEPRIDIQGFSGRFGSVPPTGTPVNDEQAMKDKFAMGDFSGALQLAESFLTKTPGDSDVRALADKCREVLEDMYTSRISDVSRTPNIAMGADQIRWLSLDHRAGFLLSMIDGISTVDDLLDVSGMARLDALRILCALLDQKVITLS